MDGSLWKELAGLLNGSDDDTLRSVDKVVREIARTTRRTPDDVVKNCLSLALSSAIRGTHSKESGFLYHLFGRGRYVLECELGGRKGLVDSVKGIVGGYALPTYLLLLVASTASLTCVIAAMLGATSSRVAWLNLLVLPIVFSCVLAPSRRAIVRAFTPRVVPQVPRSIAQLELETLLVGLPVVVNRVADVAEAVKRVRELEAEYCGLQLRYVVLADFADSENQSPDTDKEVRLAAERESETLNVDISTNGAERFLFLLRERRWSSKQGYWMGWERKRGKVIELVSLLLRGESSSFHWAFGAQRSFLRSRRVSRLLVIDQRSWLDRDSLWNLLCAASHDANHARVDDAKAKLSSGFTFFQPRFLQLNENQVRSATKVGVRVESHGQDSRTSTLFPFHPFGLAGCRGGCLLIDVRSFDQLCADFPDDEILHHDLIEGFVGGTAEVSSATVQQVAPYWYLSRLVRGGRWLRGTVQLLTQTGPFARTSSEEYRRNPLPVAGRVYIYELVLAEQSVVASALLSCYFAVTHSPLFFLISILVTRSNVAELRRMVGAVSWLCERLPPSGDLRTLVAVYSRLLKATLQGLNRGALVIAMNSATLCINAAVVASSTLRAIWRSVLTKRRMLQWSDSTEVSGSELANLSAYWLVLWPASIAPTVTLILVLRDFSVRSWLSAFVCVIWIVSPVLAWILDWLKSKR